MNYFKPKKGKTYTLTFLPPPCLVPTYHYHKPHKKITTYKEAPGAVKDKVKKIRKKWLTYHNFFVRPFVFQFRKIYLRLDGVQRKGESVYYMWTILYNRDPFHRNSTTIAVRFE